MTDKAPLPDGFAKLSFPDKSFFEKPEHSTLLQVMLNQQRFSYQQLAELADTSVNALRKRFAEQPEWRHILKVVGNVPSRQPGPKQKLFRLKPNAAEAIRMFSAPPDQEIQLIYFHPQLNSARSLLENADRCIERSPGISFDLFKRAQQLFDLANSYLDEGEDRGVLQKSETVRAEIDGLKREFGNMLSKLTVASETRLYGDEGIETSERNAVKASHDDDGMSKYFYTMPGKSIRGYGGAILAKSNTYEANHENLNKYFAKRIGDDRDNNPFAEACGHALNEILRLSVHETAWVEVAERVLDGVRRTTTLVSQCAVLEVLRGARELETLEFSLKVSISDVLRRHDSDLEVTQPGTDELLDDLSTGKTL